MWASEYLGPTREIKLGLKFQVRQLNMMATAGMYAKKEENEDQAVSQVQPH